MIAAMPRAKRPAARLLLRLASERLPLRGVGKRSFLQALDVARGAARRAGEHLAAEGHLDDPDDVFYLTVRRAHRRPAAGREGAGRQAAPAPRRVRAADDPGELEGNPGPGADRRRDADDADEQSLIVEGIGVSAGVAEGPVRVVTDPAFADVEADEILVARTTDPSWCSIMFVSSALVMDIGGQMSHAAVVARELGLPCVVNTRTGTRRLRTGDRVRVDGSAGTVEILERAPELVEA